MNSSRLTPRPSGFASQHGSLIIGTSGMADRVRSHDWSATPLGAIESWSETLIASVNALLSTPFPSSIFWGAEQILLYNDGYRPFLGGKHPAALGRPASASWGEVWQAVGPVLEDVFQHGTTTNVQNALLPILFDGRLEDRYWTYCFYPLYERGRIFGVVEVAFDSTSEVLATRQLRESEARATRVLQSIGDAVIVTDAETRITRMNPVAEALTGWADEDAQGHGLAEVFRIVNETTRRPVESPADKVKRLGSIVGLANHTILLRRDGTETPIDDSGAPIRDADGKMTGIVVIFRDIGERRKAEKALQRSEERLRLATETAQLGTWELDIASGRMECSALCKANYGRSSNDVFHYEDLQACIHPEDRPRMQTAVHEALLHGSLYRCEYRIYWPDGSMHWTVASGRTISTEPQGPLRMVGVTLDVTDRHLATQALLQSEKLAAVGRLAASIAHEINNPLEAVTNLLYLARDSQDMAEIQGYLGLAERELHRVSVISNQTLRFHKQSTSPRPVTCEDLIESVLSVYQGKIVNSHVRIEKRKRAGKPVLCFEGEIRQVLSNLVGNAIDAMPHEGGRLLLRSREGADRPSGREGLVITVADTGGGMSREVQRKIFEPFFTTKGIGGNGLGLWVSQEIVARHRGTLRVRSSERRGASGTVFTLFLPFAAVSR